MQTPIGKGAVVRRMMRVITSDWMIPDFGLDGSSALREARIRSAQASQAACQRRRARELRILETIRDRRTPSRHGGAPTPLEKADGSQA